MANALPVLVAGGGIAGLSVALALAAEGFAVRIFEAAAGFREIGAGLQLSPNATHILDRLGVMQRLSPQLTRPEGVRLRDATSLRSLTEIPLGGAGTSRWGSPYVVAHRAAIQQALVDAARASPRIEIEIGCTVRDAVFGSSDVTVSLERDGTTQTVDGSLLIAADGVWSTLRRFSNEGRATDSLFSNLTAWRATLDLETAEALGVTQVIATDRVSTFLDPSAHLVAYPVAGGDAINLVAITRGGSGERSWSRSDERPLLAAFLDRLPAPLKLLGGLPDWTRWPLYEAPAELNWVGHRFALVGDAAHAMLPFAAQGAAMAVEDAAVLAWHLARSDTAGALKTYETSRKKRVAKVRQRGRLNRLAWHATGPIALGRDLVFRLKGPQSLAADLDWLYGWKEPAAS